MAAEFLASHGIDLTSILPSAASPSSERAQQLAASSTPVTSLILNARLPQHPPSALFDVAISPSTRLTTSVERSGAATALSTAHLPSVIDANGALLAPALCHAHIHLDKPFLLSSPAHSHLRIRDGTFAEAMSLTSSAKSSFTLPDLLSRGRRLVRRSLAAGVTSMRAFVEVDEIVNLTALEAAETLQAEFHGRVTIQITAFAQLALFSSASAARRRSLLLEALSRPAVDVIGTTPYVEDSRPAMEENVRWAVEQALMHQVHLDFHLDYNLDASAPPLIHDVLSTLAAQWPARARPGRTICLGHCARLTLLSEAEWADIDGTIKGHRLPVSFVGLPTSDLFMMARPEADDAHGKMARQRGTLQVPHLIEAHALDAAVAVNNVGNAFTPQGSCDALAVAALGVGVYQTARERDTGVLMECVSTRARRAIGLGLPGEGRVDSSGIGGGGGGGGGDGDEQAQEAAGELAIVEGTPADFVLLSNADEGNGDEDDEGPMTVSRAVFDPTGAKRRAVGFPPPRWRQ